jgi:hypothetical protein
LWSGLSLHHAPAQPGFRCCPSSLYTFRRARYRPAAWLGIAMARSGQGFPDFEQFYAARFRAGTQSLKSDASTIPPRPRRPPLIGRLANQAKRPFAGVTATAVLRRERPRPGRAAWACGH